MILILAAWPLHERVTRRLVALSLVAVAGMLLVVYDPGSSGQWLGVALTLAGVACCATYTVIARRWVGTADSTAHIITSQQIYALGFGMAFLVTLSLLGSAEHPGR